MKCSVSLRAVCLLSTRLKSTPFSIQSPSAQYLHPVLLPQLVLPKEYLTPRPTLLLQTRTHPVKLSHLRHKHQHWPSFFRHPATFDTLAVRHGLVLKTRSHLSASGLNLIPRSASNYLKLYLILLPTLLTRSHNSSSSITQTQPQITANFLLS
jgi:hypothetical protein